MLPRQASWSPHQHWAQAEPTHCEAQRPPCSLRPCELAVVLPTHQHASVLPHTPGTPKMAPLKLGFQGGARPAPAFCGSQARLLWGVWAGPTDYALSITEALSSLSRHYRRAPRGTHHTLAMPLGRPPCRCHSPSPWRPGAVRQELLLVGVCSLGHPKCPWSLEEALLRV